MTLKWNFRKGGGGGGGVVQTKKPSVGGVWIFSGTIHSLAVLCLVDYVNLTYMSCKTELS